MNNDRTGTTASRRTLLRADAIYLVVAGAGGFCADVAGIFLAAGPQGRVLAAAPSAGIGFIEAHGLAVIIGVLFWRAEPARSWHFTAVAVHVLLGTANLVFWQLFVAGDMLVVGYVTTALHWLFAALQLVAALKADTSASRRT